MVLLYSVHHHRVVLISFFPPRPFIVLGFAVYYSYHGNGRRLTTGGIADQAATASTTATTIMISPGVAMLTSKHQGPITSHRPPASRLPIEILQQIYHSLSAPDFDAARHTCQLWLFASLNRSLLLTHLQNGGWQAGAEQDLQDAADYFGRKNGRATGFASQANTGNVGSSVSAEWILSKRLAAETRLCADWRGIEFRHGVPTGERSLDRMIGLHAVRPPIMKPAAYRGAISSTSPASFTVSGCCKYVLLAQDRTVYIYHLQSFKSGIRPLTSIICHRRVVRVSMDTSCGRYAVAILLEGRVGMCCEVRVDQGIPPESDRLRSSMSMSDFRHFDVRTTSRRGRAVPRQPPLDFDLFSTTRSDLNPQAESYRRRGHPLGGSSDSTYMTGSAFTLTDSNCHKESGEEFNPPIPNGLVNDFCPQKFVIDRASESAYTDSPKIQLDPLTGTSVLIEVGARRVYKNLCSAHDPPLSVAICPQRQCVAFGCKSGVELQWIDALRGSTLSR